MEPLRNDIIRLANNNWEPQAERWSKDYADLLAKAKLLIVRMWVVANQVPPDEPEWLEEQAKECLRLWKGIPLAMWAEAVNEAIIASGSFVATPGLVVKAWRDKRKEIEANAENEAWKARRAEETGRYLGLYSPENRPPSGEEINQNLEEFRRIRRSLGDLT